MERPFMFMQSEDAGNINRLFFERARNPAYYVTVKGSKHFNYSDFSLLSPDYKKAGLLGPIEGKRMERIIMITSYSNNLLRTILKSNSCHTAVDEKERIASVCERRSVSSFSPSREISQSPARSVIPAHAVHAAAGRSR